MFLYFTVNACVSNSSQSVPWLKLSYNSTRRARACTKLGFFWGRPFLPTSFGQLVPQGGCASELILLIGKKVN